MHIRYAVAAASMLAAGAWHADALAQSAPDPASSAAYRKAASRRTAEDAKLVWTASQVALVAKEVAPNVYAVYADDAAQKTAAGIPVATSGGFIIGERAVMVIDTMLNRQLAGQVMALVRERTKKPIRYIVNTSYHGDHSYGNQFFPADAQIIQHRATQDYIRQSFAKDVAFMTKNFGSNQGLAELKPVPASVLLGDKADITIDLGGQQARIRHIGFAQTPGDLWVTAAGGKVLFTGNPVIARAPAFPWLLDGHLREALATMTALRATLAADAVVVPGHGEPTTVKAVDDHIAYLDRLKLRIEQSIAARKSRDETVGAAGMPEYTGYKIYPWVHLQVNVPAAYDELSKN
jgi:glyoxylase-like metal-dependent hydrolase (beta-lactamase superfamily II)